MFATQYHDGPELYSPLPLCLCISRLRQRRIPAPDTAPPPYAPVLRDGLSSVTRLRQSGLTLFPCEADLRFTVCGATTNLKIRLRYTLSGPIILPLLGLGGLCGIALGLVLDAEPFSLPMVFCAYLACILPLHLMLTFHAWRKSEEKLCEHLHDVLDAYPKQIPCRVGSAAPHATGAPTR